MKRTIELAGRLISAVGAVVMLVLVFFTAADVILRYVFNRPILGGVELTEFMMAIVAGLALGYTAVREGHVSVDLVISRFSPRVQAIFNGITSFLGLGTFVVITWQSIVYAESQRLGGYASGILLIPVYPFVWFVVFGSATMCLIFLHNLVGHLTHVIKGTRWWVWAGLISVIALVLVLFAAPVWGEGLIWKVSPFTAGFLCLVLLLVMLFSGIYVGMAMLLVGFLGLVYIQNSATGIAMMGTLPYTILASYAYSVLPLFVLMGCFCFYAGISRDLYDAAHKWLGSLPGGLGMATVCACAVFSSVSGSSIACAATFGKAVLPEMKRYNYDPALAAGSVAAGGTLDCMIPPSVLMIIYCILTEQSVGKLFIAGFIPGIILALFYISIIYVLCKRNPLLAPRGSGSATTFKAKFASLKGVWMALLLFVVIIGGLYLGVFTPTEAAGMGAFGAFIFTVAQRKLSWQALKTSLNDSAQTMGMCFLILIGGILLGRCLAVSGLPARLAEITVGLGINRYLIVAAIVVLYIILGCIMVEIAMVILTVPIFFPVMLALGFDPIWFGVVIIMMCVFGMITPPVGIVVYILKGLLPDVPMFVIFRGAFPFFIAAVFLIVLLIAFPQIALFLPSLMK